MKINEFEKGGVTQQQLDALEKVLDQVFSKVGIDIEFTRHFIDRVNDERNVKPISIKELAMLFKKEFIKYGKPIAQLGPDAQAVMKDLETDINIPFVLNWNGKELELVAKTVMRKKNFKTPNPEFPVEGKLPPHLAKHFDKDGDAVKGSWKDGKWTADKKQPKKVKYTVKDVTPKGYGPVEEDFDWSQTAAGKRGLKNPGNKPIVKTLGKKEPFTNNDWSRTSAGKKGLKNPGPRKPMAEDFGSVPPLPELIIMAVAAKTSVDILKGMFKTAIATGKGLKKLNNLRKKAARIGQGVADYAMPESIDEATKDELMSMLKDRQKKAFYDAALTALDRLVKAKGNKQSVGGYAFDIARAFAGIDAKELVNMYNQINEWGLARKQRVAKQSDPLTVLDTLSARNDNAEFPIKFYDDEIIKVTPTQARRFMNAYLKMEPEKRDIIDKYIKSKRGFKQAIQTLDIREDAFDLLSAALDWDK